jgi:RNA polymerase sigma-70 factor (ECF subfamily)
MSESDRKLADAHLQGEAGAFEALVRRYGPAVLGYLTKMTHNPHQAEDFFQETFRKVYQKLHTFTGDDLRPWIFAIAANTAFTGFRKEKHRPAVSIDRPCTDGVNCPVIQMEDTKEADPARRAIRQEQKQQVRKALMGLPEKQRTAVILLYYHKFSYQQIADALQCTIGAVKTHIFRAMKQLAEQLPDLRGGADECRI